MSEKSILVEREGAVGWVRINRPERLNAFVSPMREQLDGALAELEADGDVRCVVLTGVGRAFSTGGDVGVMADLIKHEDAPAFEALVRAGARVVQRIDEMSKPVVAAVNGPAAGAGACLALACDMRLASEAASIGFAFARVGLHPDWGGTFFLPRLVGPALAAELVLTGGMIGAERAERLGLFNRVVPAAELEPTARGVAGQIAAGPREVIAQARRALRRSLNTCLPEMLELEVQAQLSAFRSPDFREGITAFVEKRAPRFGRGERGERGERNGHHPPGNGRAEGTTGGKGGAP
ncbi:MAG TPA: enoyl-CoA hydratase-related protein [Longimicrobiales bacterium]